MGPLAGLRVIELAGIGPAPYAAMLLGDLGAEVIRVDRPTGGLQGIDRLTGRNRRSVGLNLKHPEAVTVCLDIVATADALIEGMRPGVAERLGIGPEPCLDRNPRLVYGRMTGWGQEGAQRDRAGHDINYVAVSGALGSIGQAGGKPIVPLNLVGDLGGGALFLVMGVLAALVERNTSGSGQVVDAAMVDGAASLMTMFYEMKALDVWDMGRGGNLLDGGAPFYDTYETEDGQWMAVGSLEPQFFATMLDVAGIDGFSVTDQYQRSRWPELRGELERVFLTRSRDEWTALFEGTDACVWPVLSMSEAPDHPINRSRGVFTEVGGIIQPSPAPRFSRTKPDRLEPTPPMGVDTDQVLEALGYGPERIRRLHECGAVFSPA
jgi:alpha-methylacyl-CoA racemase